MILTKMSICTSVLEEGTFLRLIITHDCCKRSTTISTDHGQVDIGVLTHLPNEEVSFRIVTCKAGSNQETG